MSPSTAPLRRQAFVATALDQLRCPYIWGAKGEHHTDGNLQVRAFDCSGLITYTLFAIGGPDWRSDKGSEALFDTLPGIEEHQLVPGDLVFYGPGFGERPVNHVVMFLGGLGFVLGACGGNSDTKTVEIAKRTGACVKVKPAGVQYRKDLVGFRSLSHLLTT
jgi:cell wall-associated NlpC family hydrolase